MRDADLRPGETAAVLPGRTDARLVFIGTIHTPWPDRGRCPRQGSLEGPDCTLAIDPLWAAALDDLQAGATLQVLYWLHEARRDLTRQRPRGGHLVGTFALRSPVRPNPIGSSRVLLRERTGTRLVVRGLDCVDGTPLLDIKPERCPAAGGVTTAADPFPG